ncbi:hypothetical protein Y034_4985 [Burkholderia pseudomallei MSHR449]|nr:hypothetical protein Y034_4985 [Burkholderia pseudomallei MSHR449]
MKKLGNAALTQPTGHHDCGQVRRGSQLPAATHQSASSRIKTHDFRAHRNAWNTAL